MTIGKRIKMLRENAGLTQKELAQKSGTAVGTIQQYEYGKRQPRLEQILKIASALNADPADLVHETTTQSPDCSKNLTQCGNEEKLKRIYVLFESKTSNCIKNERLNAGLKQEELATQLGVPVSTIEKWETGTELPKIEDVTKMAKLYNIPASCLIGKDQRSDDYFYAYEIGYRDRQFEDKAYNHHFTEIEQNLLDLFYELNELGQKNAIERLKELTEVPRYQCQEPLEGAKSKKRLEGE